MDKRVKSVIFAALLVVAGYFFGSVCQRITQQYEVIFSPSGELLSLALWLLSALGVVAVTAGLVAALVRPLWACFIAFALSGLAMLLAWEPRKETGLLALVYFIASLLYTRGVAGEMENRLSFSVRPISESQSILLTALIIVACGGLYLGYAAQIEREGFSIPAPVMDMIMEGAEKEIGERMPAAEREAALAKFREQFIGELEGFVEVTVKPYEQFIPIGVAIGLFWSLETIIGFLSWIPVLVLRLIFPILTALGVTKVITETREAKKLAI